MASLLLSMDNRKSASEIPVLEEFVHELRESTASFALTSNTSLRSDDLSIDHSILLSQLSESDEAAEETSSAESIDLSSEKTTDTIVDALNSLSKRISIEYNSTDSTSAGETEEQSASPTSVPQVAQIHPPLVLPPPPSGQATAVVDTTRKKQHIMISYNRSCEDACHRIRNELKKEKYRVWMDVYDMRDNFIEGMAKAIRNSYIVLMCINYGYDKSYWCKKEAEDIAIKGIKFIPCFMEAPFKTDTWLEFLIGGNIWIDFSQVDQFDKSFGRLIEEITAVEDKLEIHPRETPPTTPSMTVPTPATLDDIMRNFKTWVEDNRQELKRLNRKQSAQLINQLTQALQSDSRTPDDQGKRDLLEQLLLSTSRESHDVLPKLVNSLTTPNPMIKGLLFLIALWAVRVVFKRN